MKRETQVPGVRRWFGDDLLSLQSEPLKAIDAIIGAYNKPYIIAGCEVTNGKIAKGYVALSVGDEPLKIMPFAETATALPCFLVAQKINVENIYADGIARLAAHQYKAVVTSTQPTSGSYIKVEASGKANRMVDVMQDAAHLMVSDVEKSLWNTKETIEGATAKVATAKSEALQYTDTNVSQARTEAQQYTNAKVADLVGSSPAALDTLNELASALGKDPNFATTVTTKLSEKADRTETVLEGGEIAEDPYTDTTAPCSRIVFNNTQAVSNRGAVAQFCTANQGVALQAHADSDRFFVARLEKDNMGAADKPRPQTWHWNKFELWHRGNLDMRNYVEVARAGRVYRDGSTYEAYKGAVVNTEKLTTGTYRISHNAGTSSNMIVITPLGTITKSFAVTKYANYCDVKFDDMADFEIQVLKY